MLKLNLVGESELILKAEPLLKIIGAKRCSEGITVKAVKGERIGVCYRGGEATVYYDERVRYYRGLGILAEHLKSSLTEEFEVTEDGFFKTVSTMVDTSRCGVPTVNSIKRLLDHLALMGYNMMMLYTEDTVELEGRPYFGYMRGRYTVSDLHEIDDYAYGYGIEVIPCIECYGHMEKYLIWPEAAPIRDTSSVMLARSEETFAFVEQLIATVSSAFRSRRIHIGMDEAWDMGRGEFLDKHGYVPPFDIFNEYMERLIAITDKYGLRPMMWSDMYFRISNKKSNGYYEEHIEIPEEVKAKIPRGVELVFWHYGEHHHCDGYMLKKHKALDRNIIFAGGNWGWIGHFPENNYMMSTNKYSLGACRENDVREAMFTIWSNDNAECDLFANLFGLSYFAELCYDKNVDEKKLKSRFEATTGGDYDLFYKMSYYQNDFENSNDYERYSLRFLGKALFWQDIMEGLFDTHLFEKPMSAHYARTAEYYRDRAEDESFGYLYRYAECVFDYLAKKCGIAEKLVPAYKAGDRDTLSLIARELLPELKKSTEAVHAAHKAAWFTTNKILGWSNLDVRYGGVEARCDTASYLLERYLSGDESAAEELAQERLHKGIGGFAHYSSMASVNLKT